MRIMFNNIDIMIIIIILMITLNGAIEDFFFFTVSSLCRKLSPTGLLKWPGCNCVQITCNTSGAHHVQHVVCHVVQHTARNAGKSFLLVPPPAGGNLIRQLGRSALPLPDRFLGQASVLEFLMFHVLWSTVVC